MGRVFGRTAFHAVLALLAGVSVAQGASMAANQSTIKTFLGGEGGILAFDEDGDNGRIKWVDLNDAGLTINTLGSETNCGDVIISHDGTRVLYVQSDKIYAQRLSGGSRVYIGDGVNAFWYREGGGDYIVYCDPTAKYSSNQGDTYQQRIKNGIEPDGSRTTIYNQRAMSAGRSANGRWLGETYGDSYAYDLDNHVEYGPAKFRKADGSQEGQTCNGSMAPDNSNRFLKLVLPHQYFRLYEYASGTDDWREVRTFTCPSGASDREWQRPEYSRHPDYATAVFTSDKGTNPYELYLVNLTNGNRLKVVNGDIGNTHLYVGATPSSSPTLSLSTGSLSYTAEENGSDPADQTVTVSNTGSGTLTNVTVSEDASWLTVNRSGSGNTQTLTNQVSVSGLSPDTYTATVTVSGGGATNTVSYTVTLQVFGPPVLASLVLSPQAASVTPDGSIELTVEARDQNGQAFAAVITWAVDGPGSLSATTSGSAVTSHSTTLSAGGTEGQALVIASSGIIADTAVITITDVHLKINCGMDDINVTGWEQEDAYVDAGDEYLFSQDADPTGITNAAPADIYRSCRHRSPHTYVFPVPDGDYTLRLHIVVNSTDRSFTYVAEGVTIEENWNPATEAGGTYQVLVKDYAVSVSDGDGLTLACSSTGDVFECGIEVIHQGSGSLPPVEIVAPNGGETYEIGQTLTIQWTSNNQTVFNDAVVEISPDQGESWYDITGGGSVAVGEATWGNLPWTIPSTVNAGGSTLSMASSTCLVRIYQYGEIGTIDQSAAVFTVTDGAAVRTDARAGRHAAFAVTLGHDNRISLTLPESLGPMTVELFTTSGRCIRRISGATGMVSFDRSVVAGRTCILRARHAAGVVVREVVVVQ